MVRLEVRIFCGLQWKRRTINIISDSEENALKQIDKLYPLEFRYEPYEDKKDSLEIIDYEESEYFII